MDPFFWQATANKLIQQSANIALTVAMVLIVIFVSEKLFGLNIRGAIDVFEALAKKQDGDNPWPLALLLIGGLLGIIWLVRGFG